MTALLTHLIAVATAVVAAIAIVLAMVWRAMSDDEKNSY